MPIAISVVVPTRNGGPRLARVIEAVRQQRVVGPLDITIVDCGSTDGSVAAITDRVTRVVNVDPERCNPGLAWNVGIQASRGDLVVLLAQSVLPTPDDWLSTLAALPEFDESIAGAFAQRRPARKATVVVRRRLKRQRGLPNAVRIASLGGQAEFNALTPSERLDRCAFDTVCACIRRSAWRAYPFPEVPAAEDLEWGRDVLLAGYRLAYVPAVVVRHSRNRSAWDEFRRTRVLHGRLFELFEFRSTRNVVSLVGSVIDSAAQFPLLEVPTPSRLPRALGLAIAWPLGEYLGAGAAARARRRGQHGPFPPTPLSTGPASL
jgi:rhamnosyltransferase